MATYEKRDIDLRRIMAIVGGLVVGTLIVHGICMALVSFTKPPWRSWKQTVEPVHTQPLPPRLQSDPSADLAAMRAEEEAAQTQYGWADRPHGVVRIPIDQAIRILVRRGLPARASRSKEDTQ